MWHASSYRVVVAMVLRHALTWPRLLEASLGTEDEFELLTFLPPPPELG